MRNIIIILLSILCYFPLEGQVMIKYHMNTPSGVPKYEMYRFNDTSKAYDIPAKFIKKGEKVFIKINKLNSLVYQPEFVWEDIVYEPTPSNAINQLFGLGGTSDKAESESDKGEEEMDEGKDIADTAVTAARSIAEKEVTTKDTTAAGLMANACHHYYAKIEDIKNLDQYKQQMISILESNITNVTDAHTELNKLPPNRAILKIISDYNISYGDMEQVYYAHMGSIQNPKVKKKAKDALEHMEKAHEEVEKGKYGELANEIIRLKEKLLNPSTYTVESGTFDPDGDEIKLKVIFKKIEESKARDLEDLVTKERIKGGMKVDFSVGPALSFGLNARDEQFESVEMPGDSIQIKSYRSGFGVRPGIAAFIHISQRRHKDISPVFSFGVGADFNGTVDTNISYYIGGGVILGKKKRVVLQLGLSLIRTNRLNPLIENNGEYKKEFINQLDNEGLVNSLKPSGFFSISYNITSN